MKWILFVECDLAAAAPLVEYLQSLDLAVCMAQTGEDALEKLRSEEAAPELLIVSNSPPDIDARQFLRQAKSIPDIQWPKVLVLDRADGYRDGALGWTVSIDAFLAKPVTVRELKQVVPLLL